MTQTLELADLRRAAREIFDAALNRVDAARAVHRAVQLDDSDLKIVETTFDLSRQPAGIYAIAIGKASHRMATALDEILGDKLMAGIITAPPAYISNHQEQWSHAPSNRWQTFAGGHPLPDEQSLAAARAAFRLLERADSESALVIFLISGGGSAMIEWPRGSAITLEDLRAANRLLTTCGATITEVNAVRRAISSVKGGALSARAPRATQVSLIISDTNSGDEAAVASGPTYEPPEDAPDARDVVRRYHLEESLPLTILRVINQALPAHTGHLPDALRQHYLLLDNHHALSAASDAASQGSINVEIARDIVEQPVHDGCTQLINRLFDGHRRMRSEQGVFCLLSGGEFACPVRGGGMGGRNLETVLRCALELRRNVELLRGSLPSSLVPLNMVVLSAGTDGLDGNSPAAGAISDQTTITRAQALGLEAQSFLDASDAYSYFNALDDVIVTGATGTNVRDLRVMLIS
jgi:glycerate 2-kinase